MDKLKEELQGKARELLIWLNDNLLTPGRIRVMFGRGKSIILIFSDSTSESLEEYGAKKDLQAEEKHYKDVKHAVSLGEEIETRIKALKYIDPKDNRFELEKRVLEAKMAEFQKLKDEINRVRLEESIQGKPAIARVFQIISAAGHLSEQYFHDPEALSKIIAVLVKIKAELDEND